MNNSVDYQKCIVFVFLIKHRICYKVLQRIFGRGKNNFTVFDSYLLFVI